jgi:hypothetical protein
MELTRERSDKVRGIAEGADVGGGEWRGEEEGMRDGGTCKRNRGEGRRTWRARVKQGAGVRGA